MFSLALNTVWCWTNAPKEGCWQHASGSEPVTDQHSPGEYRCINGADLDVGHPASPPPPGAGVEGLPGDAGRLSSPGLGHARLDSPNQQAIQPLTSAREGIDSPDDPIRVVVGHLAGDPRGNLPALGRSEVDGGILDVTPVPVRGVEGKAVDVDADASRQLGVPPAAQPRPALGLPDADPHPAQVIRVARTHGHDSTIPAGEDPINRALQVNLCPTVGLLTSSGDHQAQGRDV